MALKLDYFGQSDGTTVPDVVLTGDPGTDQATLTAAGYLGGRIMAVKAGVNQPNIAGSPCIVPADGDSATNPPYGALLNGPGEFAGAIGPSGSRKAPVVRALFRATVNNEAFAAADMPNFVLGGYVYCGGTTNSTVGKWTSGNASYKGTQSYKVGICLHVPTAPEPWLTVASLI